MRESASRRGRGERRDHPLAASRAYQYDLNLADIAEVWRRGSVIASWLLDLTAQALLRGPDSATSRAGCRIPARADGRSRPPSTRACPAGVLSTALFERFSSHRTDDYADRILSAMRFAFGGHLEKKG